MTTQAEKANELAETLLENYSGSPEELGSLLADATAPVWYGFDRTKREDARRVIRNIPGGKEYLEFERSLEIKRLKGEEQ